MEFKVTFISICLVFIALGQVEAKFKIAHFALTTDESFMSTKYELKEKDGQNLIDEGHVLHKDLTGDISAHGNISAIHPDGTVTLLSQLPAFDFCKFLVDEKTAPPLQAIWDQMKTFQHPQLPTGCPIKAGEFGIKDYLPDPSLIPSVPAGKYRIEADWDHKEGGIEKNVYRMLLDIEVS